MRFALVAAALVAASCAADAQMVFKCQGPNGRVIYSDSPCGGGAVLDRSVTDANTVRAIPKGPSAQGERTTVSPQQMPESAPGASRPPGFCPEEIDVKNLQTSLSSYEGRVHNDERIASVLRNEIATWQRCHPASSPYTGEDWTALAGHYREFSSSRLQNPSAVQSIANAIQSVHIRARSRPRMR